MVWVEVSGLPPSAWSITNLINIGKIWGKVKCDERTVKVSSFGSERMLIDTCSRDPIDGHVAFVLRVHHLTLRIAEIPICPSNPCSLASTVEAVVMVVFPSSGEVEGTCNTPMHQARDEGGRAFDNSSSRDYCLIDCGQSQESGAVGPTHNFEHVPVMIHAPKKPPQFDQELVLEVIKDIGLFENGFLLVAFNCVAQHSDATQHDMGQCVRNTRPMTSSPLFPPSFEPYQCLHGFVAD